MFICQVYMIVQIYMICLKIRNVLRHTGNTGKLFFQGKDIQSVLDVSIGSGGVSLPE